MSPEEFNRKLSQMYARINKSITILRDQITNNQSAPFLGNLYMQLGDLLAQKSNVLYYIKMESAQGEVSEADKKFKEVVDATKEAISIYQKVLAEFPKFEGRSRAMYQVALAAKSIDEMTLFMQSVDQLIKAYPKAKDGVKGKLLLALHLFERGVFDEAEKLYRELLTTEFAYERNQAKFRLAILKSVAEKYPEAMELLVQIVTDQSFRDEDNESEVNLKKKSVRTNLKREALLESVRPYSEIHAKVKHDPVGYYSSIAPTENMFQEVMEKLALRYINLKKYSEAIVLLRVMADRTSSPEKVLTLYKEVLLMIPINERVTLPVQEIRHLLTRYVQWKHFYRLPQNVATSAEDFFEKQLRDLGTRSHDLGKEEKDTRKRAVLLFKAVEFYDLYLSIFFDKPYAAKMAVNAGDAYFRLGLFMQCGDYYLRAYKGEWGSPGKDQQLLVLKNAVYCLEKEREYTFYETRRVKGLLIEGLKILMKVDPQKRQDPKTNFVLAKAIYDQGFYDQALPRLLEFMKKYPTSKYTLDSTNLILDYFNIKSDYEKLILWCDKILALKLPNNEVNSLVSKVREQGKHKNLQAKVESSANFDGLSQAKSYLSSVSSLQDVELRNLALSKALEAAKRERDRDTFFKAAKAMLAKESDANKKLEIQLLLATEYIKMSSFGEAKNIYRSLIGGGMASRKEVAQGAMALALSLRDWSFLGDIMDRAAGAIDSAQRTQVAELVASALESPLRPPSTLLNLASSFAATPSVYVALWKSRRTNPRAQSLINANRQQVCQQGASTPGCLAARLDGLESKVAGLLKSFNATAADVGQLEKMAATFAQLTGELTSLEGADSSLDVLTSLVQSQLYQGFARYLKRVAAGNAQIAPMINAKVGESARTAQQFKERCKKIISSSDLVSSINGACQRGQLVGPWKNAWQWPSVMDLPALKLSRDEQFPSERKALFSLYEAASVIKMTTTLYRQQYYHEAAASASYGLSLGAQQAELQTLLGCSVLELGHLSEAAYYLKIGAEVQGLKNQCLGKLRSASSR